MGTRKMTLLYVTDLYYQSKGRIYHEEDLFLASQLRSEFDIVLCHPTSAAAFVGHTDGILFRNAGPVILYQDEYRAFRDRVLDSGTRIYNTLTGKADMRGKQYLVDLTKAGYPVIPGGARRAAKLTPASRRCQAAPAARDDEPRSPAPPPARTAESPSSKPVRGPHAQAATCRVRTGSSES